MVARPATMWRLAPAAALCVALAIPLALALPACGGSAPRPGGVSASDAVIRVDAPVSSATITINGRELGTVAMLKRGIALSPGTHRLEVRHPDYHAYYELLELEKKERRVIVVELAERLP